MSGALEVIEDLEAEQRALRDMLAHLDEADWRRPTPAPGWDVRDQVSHLAHTEELAHDTAAGGRRPFNEEVARFADGDAFTEAGCEMGRCRSGPEVAAWWWDAAERTRSVLRRLDREDPAVRVPWGLGMGLRAFATARLMEHWAHGLDVHAALDVPSADTARLAHVAWLGANALPYAFRLAGVAPPEGRTLRFELTSPDTAIGPSDATDLIRGPTGQWCRLAVRRISRADAGDLEASGPLAELALDHARAFL
ncbi:MAG: maleylpyruvate isomerase family mycothiol-dependent enzyme [Acidimicrobiales bacterium]